MGRPVAAVTLAAVLGGPGTPRDRHGSRPESAASARDPPESFGDRVQLLHGEYAEMPALLARLGVPSVDGILLDLGVSSPQLDHAERGFSFMPERAARHADGSDARADRARADRRSSSRRARRLIRELGEERHAAQSRA